MLHRSQWTFRALRSLKFHAIDLVPDPWKYILLLKLKNWLWESDLLAHGLYSNGTNDLTLQKTSKFNSYLENIQFLSLCFGA